MDQSGASVLGKRRDAGSQRRRRRLRGAARGLQHGEPGTAGVPFRERARLGDRRGDADRPAGGLGEPAALHRRWMGGGGQRLRPGERPGSAARAAVGRRDFLDRRPDADRGPARGSRRHRHRRHQPDVGGRRRRLHHGVRHTLGRSRAGHAGGDPGRLVHRLRMGRRSRRQHRRLRQRRQRGGVVHRRGARVAPRGGGAGGREPDRRLPVDRRRADLGGGPAARCGAWLGELGHRPGRDAVRRFRHGERVRPVPAGR